MKKTLTLIATAAATFTIGTAVAHAQDALRPGQPGASTSPANPSTSARDTSELDIMRDRDEKIRREDRQGRKKGKGPVAATASDLVVGASVHDMSGAELGTIESLTGAGAVVRSEVGKVEIPMEAFGTDGSTLMIAMPKSDFDAAVAAIVAGG